MEEVQPHRLDRRQFLGKAARASLLTLSLPALLEACTRDQPAVRTTSTFAARSYKQKTKAIQAQAEKMVGDVLDFQLTSDDWEGVFGFAKFRLHRGVFDGNDVYFIRTDTSDQSFATSEKLVFVPKLGPLAKDGLSGNVFLFPQDTQPRPAVFSSEPGRDDYSPAWRVNQVTWKGQPRSLPSVAEVQSAESAGDITVERNNVVLNAAIVKWSSGELAVDPELKAYLGGGQLIEKPDTSGLTVTFKLQECFPNTRYIVTDHSIRMAAEMTKTSLAPGLQSGPTDAGVTGRTNVFMNGLKGPGPMGFQPSAFDFAVGDAAWSPYWDHFTYAWKKGQTARLLRSQTEIHKVRDAGDLEEFPGTPDTKGEVFTVNCPAPVRAPNVFA
jgi:hypothetical protein